MNMLMNCDDGKQQNDLGNFHHINFGSVVQLDFLNLIPNDEK